MNAAMTGGRAMARVKAWWGSEGWRWLIGGVLGAALTGLSALTASSWAAGKWTQDKENRLAAVEKKADESAKSVESINSKLGDIRADVAKMTGMLEEMRRPRP